MAIVSLNRRGYEKKLREVLSREGGNLVLHLSHQSGEKFKKSGRPDCSEYLK